METRRAARACFFDASALVKVFALEEGRDVVRGWFDRESTKYTTPFCFHETLGGLKHKWLRKELPLEAYRDACFRLTVWFGASSKHTDDIKITSYEELPRLKHLIRTYEMDASDAFQVISVKHGYFQHLRGASQTVFVTADEQLGCHRQTGRAPRSVRVREAHARGGQDRLIYVILTGSR